MIVFETCFHLAARTQSVPCHAYDRNLVKSLEPNYGLWFGLFIPINHAVGSMRAGPTFQGYIWSNAVTIGRPGMRYATTGN